MAVDVGVGGSGVCVGREVAVDVGVGGSGVCVGREVAVGVGVSVIVEVTT